MIRKPSSSTLAMSPVLYHSPSKASLVRSSLPKYPVMTLGPLMSRSPGSPWAKSSPLSGSTIRVTTPGTGSPMVPNFLVFWRNPGTSRSGRLTETTGLNSVQPSRRGDPNFSSQASAKLAFSFSAPAPAMRTDLKSSGLNLRR